MKTLLILAAGALLCAPAINAQGCTSCAQKAAAESVTTQTVPAGRIENLMPIGIVAILGCETCTGKAVDWALQQGSSADDIERALKSIAAMQNLECFKQQFGPDAAARLEKPLAAARKALQEAAARSAK
jgi:hypothetical protein